MARIPIDDDNPQVDQQLEGEPRDEGGDDTQRLQAERDHLFDRLARATADFQNSRKRIQAEADQRLQYANANLIKSLLPVIDNFERALAVDPEKADAKTILKGMQLIHDQWLTVLRQQVVQ
jgi:molecular chaperone GrpE